MKRWGIISILLLCLILATVTACSGGDTEATSRQLVEVVKGDITVTVTGVGNIEASRETRLTFGSGGKVDKIYVKEGDKVNKGDVLAKLDTGALELAKAQAQVALTKAKVALTQAKLSQKTAEYNLKNTLDTEDALELALFNAQIDVKTAEYDVEQTRELYTWSDIEIAQANVDDAKRGFVDDTERIFDTDEVSLEEAIDRLTRYAILTEEGKYLEPEESSIKAEGYKIWQQAVVQAQKRLNTARATLNAMLSGNDLDEVAIDKLQLEATRMAEAQARKDLDELNEDITIKQLEVEKAEESVEQARQNINLAQQNVNLAQKSLAQAQKYQGEATIVAPFDGTVARVGVKVGEFLSPAAYSGTIIVELIDLRHMELIARVDELDIVKVKAGQKVMISVDAIPEVKLEGLVTFISPVAREPGIVLFEDEDEAKEYEVKINFNIPENSPIRAGMSATAEIIVE